MRLPGPERLAEWNLLSEDDVEFLASLPLVHGVCAGLVAVHAGFEPGVPITEQDPDVCMRVRYVDEVTGRMLSLEPGNPGAPAGSVQWAERWTGGGGLSPICVVYGHHVMDVGRPVLKNDTYGIDTGCCFGGHLTAMIVRDFGSHSAREFARVPARREYAKLWTYEQALT